MVGLYKLKQENEKATCSHNENGLPKQKCQANAWIALTLVEQVSWGSSNAKTSPQTNMILFAPTP